ncbi:TPA: fimbria/pilus periplasmic chaperone [Stenotrophomonas maltophilia]|uniref:fimbria/pilus chaperone family protein n=1 Tax=Stenotrophomonas maltophilia TaxID=40324 RepID=UPI0015DC2648|nr:fimbria/pilus chaperone family protein [Stenotrophomonas maltophilia]QDL26402.1 fimbrial protein [Stenotrophomonas maltophilia]HEL3785425.1 fimbria/pilus periplasmic chaperone [Stenotrophomonas maltophilia]
MNALLSKRRGNLLAWKWLAAAALLGPAVPLQASTFALQSNTVILEEREGRTAFNISNPGSEPILLLSSVDDLDGQPMAGNILVTPAVTRIDPGQSQIVNFTLKKGTVLDREYMLRASFEGVTQKSERGMRMPIRQQIGFILQPRAVAVAARPWQDLRFSIDGDQLTVRNSGPHVVRIGPELRLQPSAALGVLPHPYLMPGETRVLTLAGEVGGSNRHVEIVPLSRYGFAKDKEQLPLQP